MADGHSWLARQPSPESSGCVRDGDRVPRARAGPCTGPLFSAQRDYLLTLARPHQGAGPRGQPSLTDAAKAEVEERMKARYPEAGSRSSPLNLDPISRELAVGLHPATPARQRHRSIREFVVDSAEHCGD